MGIQSRICLSWYDSWGTEKKWLEIIIKWYKTLLRPLDYVKKICHIIQWLQLILFCILDKCSESLQHKMVPMWEISMLVSWILSFPSIYSTPNIMLYMSNTYQFKWNFFLLPEVYDGEWKADYWLDLRWRMGLRKKRKLNADTTTRAKGRGVWLTS